MVVRILLLILNHSTMGQTNKGTNTQIDIIYFMRKIASVSAQNGNIKCQRRRCVIVLLQATVLKCQCLMVKHSATVVFNEGSFFSVQKEDRF